MRELDLTVGQGRSLHAYDRAPEGAMSVWR